MAYSFQQRLGYNRERMGQVNAEAVILTIDGVPIPIIASPILKRPFMLTSMMALLRADRQYWAIDKYQANDVVIPEPPEGSSITRANGDVFRVTKEDDNQPAVRPITSARDRYMVYSILESQTET